MIWGETWKERHERRKALDGTVVRKYALFPRWLSDGKWVWLEHYSLRYIYKLYEDECLANEWKLTEYTYV